MKKHNILKVVLISIAVMILLTWIFPAASYSTEFVDQGRLQVGLAELFSYPMIALANFGHIFAFIVLVGGFYGILYKIPAYRTFLDKIVKAFKGKELLFVSIVTVFLAFGVSFAGLQLGFIVLLPLIISLILLMGYDKIVAALTVVGSMAAGFIGLTYSTSNTSVLTQYLKLDFDYQIGVRFILLLVGVVLVLFNIFMYTKDHKPVKVIEKTSKAKDEKKEEKVEKVETKKTTKTTKSSSKSKSTSKKKTGTKSKNANKAALKDEDIIVVKESVVSSGERDSYLVPSRVDSTHKTWPFTLFFILIFVLLFVAFINWGEGGFGLKFFDDLTTGFQEYKLFKFPIFAKIYGSTVAFGSWTVVDLMLPIALVALLLVIIYNVKFDDVIDGFIAGAKKALAPAMIVLLLYVVLVIAVSNPFQLTIYKALLGTSGNLNIVTTMISTLLAAIFNIEPLYAFHSLLPYYVATVVKADDFALTGIIAQSMYGFSVLFAPTSLILMGVLSYLKVGYGTWLKNVWKLLLELFIVLLIIFIILALI